MKQLFKHTLFVLAFLVSTMIVEQAEAQNMKKRKSPPAEASADVSGTNVKVNYSQPSVKGRTVWGDLVPYDKVWRTGANEATVFEVSKDVKVEGKELKAGKYGLFTIPGEKEWTIIFNKVSDQWGSSKYDDGEDALRVTVKPKKSSNFTEMMTFKVESSGDVKLMWENMEVMFEVRN